MVIILLLCMLSLVLLVNGFVVLLLCLNDLKSLEPLFNRFQLVLVYAVGLLTIYLFSNYFFGLFSVIVLGVSLVFAMSRVLALVSSLSELADSAGLALMLRT